MVNDELDSLGRGPNLDRKGTRGFPQQEATHHKQGRRASPPPYSRLWRVCSLAVGRPAKAGACAGGIWEEFHWRQRASHYQQGVARLATSLP